MVARVDRMLSQKTIKRLTAVNLSSSKPENELSDGTSSHQFALVSAYVPVRKHADAGKLIGTTLVGMYRRHETSSGISWATVISADNPFNQVAFC